jgi:large subunit ribosomal protein L9
LRQFQFKFNEFGDVMKVILQKNVQALGKAGDIVEAAPGYYRNFLQPRGFAVLAKPGALKKREEDVEAIRKKAEAEHQVAVALAERIQGIGTVRIEAKAGDAGRLYGKVTNQHIADLLSKAAEHDIDKRSIKTTDDINALGTYKATVRLAPEVQAEFLVEVVLQGAENA